MNIGPVAFSGDGSTIALVPSMGLVPLYDADGMGRLAALPVSRYDPAARNVLKFLPQGTLTLLQLVHYQNEVW